MLRLYVRGELEVSQAAASGDQGFWLVTGISARR